MPDIRRGFVDIAENKQLHFRLAGELQLPVLVLLHQAPSSSVMFEPLMRALQSRFHLIALDMPCFGDSEALNDDISITALAHSCHQALHALSVSRYSIFGHHTGTAVAVEMARQDSTTMNSILLSGPALLNEEMRATLPSRATPFAIKADGSHLGQSWKRTRSKDNSVSLTLTHRENLLALQMGEFYQQAYQAVVDYDFSAALAQIAIPTLLIAGSKDVLHSAVAASAAVINAAHTNAPIQTATIDDAGTYVCETHVSELSALIQAFCAETHNGPR